MARVLVALTAALALVTVACAETAPGAGDDQADSFRGGFAGAEAYPLFVSSEIVVGENRFLIGLLNDEDAPIGSPDIGLSVDFYDLERSAAEPRFSSDFDFVWIEEPFNGLYVARVTFEDAGEWGAEVTASGGGIDEVVRGNFMVTDEPSTPGRGEQVPASDTPTLRDVDDLSEISTDDDPKPRFYRFSIAQALRREVPFVVSFATPKFCQTAACAPMWDIVKSVAADHPRLTFIHVEPYDLDKVPTLEPIDAALEWGLPTEPWVFVIDGEGRLVDKFEGLLDPDELRSALADLV